MRLGPVLGPESDEDHLALAVLRLDHRGFFGQKPFSDETAALEDILLARKVDLAVKIPPDFSRRIREGDSSPVQILVDGSMSNMASVRVAYTTSVLTSHQPKS